MKIKIGKKEVTVTRLTVTRLRLGKCINEYLAMMKIIESDKCQQCTNSVETVEHFLLQCPNSDLCTEVIKMCNKLNITPIIENVLANNKVIDVISRINTRKI